MIVIRNIIEKECLIFVELLHFVVKWTSIYFCIKRKYPESILVVGHGIKETTVTVYISFKIII